MVDVQDFPLSKITIRGFKSIKDLSEFEIKPVNVLIGSNGSGKSNFIEAFQLIKNVIDRRLAEYTGKKGGANKLLHFGKRVTEKIFISLHYGDTNGYSFSISPTEGDGFIFTEETGYFWDKKKHSKPFYVSIQGSWGGGRISFEGLREQRKNVWLYS